jgi:hypothetical protein
LQKPNHKYAALPFKISEAEIEKPVMNDMRILSQWFRKGFLQYI